MTSTFAIAVVGATGSVGESLLQLLEERDFPVSDLHLLASSESAGRSLAFRGAICACARWRGSIFVPFSWRSSPPTRR